MTALYGVLFLVSAETIIAGQQWLMPHSAWVPLYGNRIYGTFFQPNVLASLIATGIALTLTLLLLPGLAARPARFDGTRRSILFVLLAGLATLLVCIQSRAGWLGGIAAVLLLFRFGRFNTPNTLGAVIALTGGVVLGSAWLISGNSPLPLTDHTGSNLARWSMLSDTLAMIIEKPLLGWGYGGFEYDFQHFRVNQVPPTLVTEIARHPHNEILLWVVEGGGVGLAGVGLILAGIGMIVRQAIQRDRSALRAGHRLAGVPTALCIIVLPMAIHTLLEFPFYISTLHFVTFLLLLAQADRLGTVLPTRRTLSIATSTRLSLALAGLALSVAVLAGFTLRGEVSLTQVERFGMEDVMPLTTLPPLSRHLLLERVTFDEQVGALMTYNQTRDERLLAGYRHWAQTYLMNRIDKNVYASLITVLQHQRHTALAIHYRQEAAIFFPMDGRFSHPNQHDDHAQ
ncbi:O-antigen ligase [Serratia sp. S4]|uniref:O-antigen ligase family protein n=1 Tax=Serratia sp. S4 TaxID=768491 RepID=UPI00155A5CEA|nr:O-antigen ligase family protein [Serratia sp. S4]